MMELDSKVTFENYQSINEFHEPIHLEGPHFTRPFSLGQIS